MCEPYNPCKDNTHTCHKYAECIYLGLSSEVLYKCVCAVGFAGDGSLCGEDSDLDGWPNNRLPCKQNATYHCEKVRYLLQRELKSFRLVERYPSCILVGYH